MNKRFSTLVAAFAAITAVSSAQIGDKYVHLQQHSTSNLLTWDKASLADSVTIKAKGTAKADLDSALWKAELIRVNMPGNDSIYSLTNKATNKKLSFSAKKNGADAFGTAIAAGVDEFKIKFDATNGYSIVGTTTDGKLVALSTTAGTLLVGDISTGVAAFDIVAAGTLDLETKEDLAPVLPSFKFDFKGKDGGIFTATELIPVPITVNSDKKFRFQVVGQENSTKGTKGAQYITIDTVMIGSTSSIQVAAFQLDTIVAASKAQYGGAGNEGLQTFKLSMDLGNDSIVITTDSIVKFNNGAYYVADHGGNADKADVPYTVGYKIFNGDPVLCIDSAAIDAPFITISKGTPVKLAGGTGVYSLQLKSATGQYKDYNDMFLTGDGDRNEAVAAASEYIPSTQFYVKENEDGTYSAQAREGSSVSPLTFANGETMGIAEATELFTNIPLYAVDVAKGIYAIGANEGDTLAFTKLDVDLANKYIGYKYYTKEEMSYGAVKFNLASKAADDIYLALTQDSVIKGAKGVENAIELRLVEGADVTDNDTIYYGAQALGDTLVRVAYAMEKAYNAEGAQFAYEGAVVKLTDASNGTVTAKDKRFFFIENPAGGSYKIVATDGGDEMVTMNISNLAVTYAEPTAAVETYFNIEGAEAPVYSKVESGHYNVVNGTEMLTATAGVAKLLRVGDELKAAAEDSDFSLFVDSAYVNRGYDNTEYGYYIYKGAEVKNDTIVGNVLAAKGEFKANSATGDSAIFRAVTVVADTVAYTGDLKDGKQNKYKVRDTKNTSLVGFKVVDGEGYVIEALNASPRKSLAVVNGTVIFSNTVAPQVFTMAASEAPTANEGVEVSEVKVIAGNGNVQIVGAQGKKVVVSNILGQTIANTVISSDNATIAAPAGVVVVAVEGEEAVKAIVK